MRRYITVSLICSHVCVINDLINDWWICGESFAIGDRCVLCSVIGFSGLVLN